MEYKGHRLVNANGSKFYPVGQIDIVSYFRRRHRARRWKVAFLVIPDTAEFDVALGRRFIRQAKLFKRNPEALALSHEKLPKGKSHLSLRQVLLTL